MRSSEDNADDEFVFVANKVVTARDCPAGDAPPSSGGRQQRTLPRLNHLQPIPTTLDLQPSPQPRSGLSPPPMTTARSKATPLPPELIELLPPHLRENTVPDFGSSTPPPSAEDGEEEAAPARPPLPAKYCPGDYYNLDDTPPPTAAVSSSSSSSASSSERQLSGLIASNSLCAIGPTHTHAHHGGRAASLASTRPQALATTTASHTAPAALALTDSGISSGSSSSCSSVSSRSSSSKSLPREGSRTSLSGRPLHPPSPKFARASPGPAHPALPPSTSASAPGAEPLLTRVSYTAVLTSDGERASMVRRLEALTPTPSPLLNTFRAANASHSEHLPPEARPHTRHVATAHSSLTSMGQSKSTSTTSVTTHAPTPSHTPTATPTHTPTHTPTSRRKVFNVGAAPQGAPVSSSSVRHVTPPKPLPSVPTTTTPSSLRPQYRQFGGRPPEARPTSPPSSPELRRAWNVVGVPVVPRSGSATPSGRSPAPSPVPRPFSPTEPDSIYDNLVPRQPPLSTPATRSPPTASIPPTTQRYGAPLLPRQGPPAAPPPRSVSHSPLVGKPPSPPTQRRGASRSPTPPGRVQQGVPQRAQYVPYYPQNDGHCGGCWVPVWGSSPQLYQGPGSPPVYPAYVYHVPPSGVVCERSRSCERLPAQPSPPSSPRSGRRSASPWRGGSPSPAGARHSPSPDPVSGRPPRPRRPPMRKSKTVEVGCLGVGLPQPPSSSSGGTGAEPTPLPVHSITYLQGPPAPGVPSNHVYIHALNPPPYRKCSQPGKQHIPTIDTIHEQLNKVSNGFHDPHVPQGANKLEQAEVAKSKVTYKSSLYKCMKNLLKPIQ